MIAPKIDLVYFFSGNKNVKYLNNMAASLVCVVMCHMAKRQIK